MVIAALVLGCAAAPALALRTDSPEVWQDPVGDSMTRRTDQGNDGVLCAPNALPDLIAVELGGWCPEDPAENPYEGEWDNSSADIFRLNVVLKGLHNPPGTLGVGGQSFDPIAWGPRPVYGFIELDVDDNPDTGGELGGPAQSRYPAVISRFGLRPDSPIGPRVPALAIQMDDDFFTGPQFERSGQDFTLAMCGCFPTTIVDTFGDEDGTFDAGDRWIVSGRFFQRAGGYAEASQMVGMAPLPGLVEVTTNLLFDHDTLRNETVISLVFPLTQAGAAALIGQPVQPIDSSYFNHTSVQEIIEDLILHSLEPVSLETSALIVEWTGEQAQDHLDPTRWRVNALLATAYCTPEIGTPYIWTDTGFGEVYGDVNGSGDLCHGDGAELHEGIVTIDGTLLDSDAVVNNSVLLGGFAGNFSLYDLNYDGRINIIDLSIVPPELAGDVNRDCAVNIVDLELVLANWGKTGVSSDMGDLNFDIRVDFADLDMVLYNWNTTCDD